MTTMYPAILPLILKAVALAMAAAAVVLTILHTVSSDGAIVLLGFGLFALAVSALMQPRTQ